MTHTHCFPLHKAHRRGVQRGGEEGGGNRTERNGTVGRERKIEQEQNEKESLRKSALPTRLLFTSTGKCVPKNRDLYAISLPAPCWGRGGV